MKAKTIWLRQFAALGREIRNSKNEEETRVAFSKFIKQCDNRLHWSGGIKINPLEYYVAQSCSSVLKNLIRPRNEIKSGHSIVRYVWDAFHRRAELSESFWQEMLHLCRGASGKSNIYRGIRPPAFLKMSGSEAGRERNAELEKIAVRVAGEINKYPCGTDPKVVKAREVNRRRILKTLGGSEGDWASFEWHAANIIRDTRKLDKIIVLTDNEREAIEAARAKHLPFGVTPYYASLMDRAAHRKRDYAIRAQVIPTRRYIEQIESCRSACQSDFMGESDTSPVELVTRRYPQVAIFKPFNTCAQICTYCQRNWEINDAMQSGSLATPEKIEKALLWFERQRGLEEVLITGGDPMMMPDVKLREILARFAEMKNIRRVRIGTRTPVVLPMRFTKKIIGIFRSFVCSGKQLMIITHFEHAYEVTPQAREAVEKLRRIGVNMYNQEVFTIENSRRFETAALRRAIKDIGIDPYYNFNVKGKKETSYFQVPVARILQERKEEARLTPGTVRSDEPVFNVPRLGKNYLRAGQDHHIIGITKEGGRVYEFLPWEKNLYPSPTYVYEDTPIYGYLCRLRRRGEDINKYRNIWYYM